RGRREKRDARPCASVRLGSEMAAVERRRRIVGEPRARYASVTGRRRASMGTNMGDDTRTRSDRRDARDDDFDEPPPQSSDNTGTILATIFGIWAAVIGGIGLVWVLAILCIFAVA